MTKRPLNPTKQGPLRPYRRELRNGSRITSIRLRCFEKSPENQRSHAQKSEPTTPGRPPSPPAGELGHVGRPWPSPADTGARPSHGRAPVMGRGPHSGSPTARFRDTLRRFEVFGGSNDL